MYECPLLGIILYQYRRGQYQPVPVPVTVPETAPEAAPQRDPSFWQRMQMATGLTGTGLVIYLIVSEGSRIAFPPRNLIPAP